MGVGALYLLGGYISISDCILKLSPVYLFGRGQRYDDFFGADHLMV